ncbi:methylmalonyl-CoA mutase family protein [Neobacillus novalis]|uniref:Methylmalonyl-CoA mutase family protein n=1 Tax=Neobacillus novalis TaxID=220687 RepID=A0AA95MIZ9_9BACI|nr:methylmalonyl-CoA mutase family protein [Neobacillus novalis]WHY83987.1 methylmalonyl-CoA mutase family protein [Neobacillus novalis]
MTQKTKDIAIANKMWMEERLEPWLLDNPERNSEFLTKSGLPVKALYTPEDLGRDPEQYLNEINFPGQFPFVRGVDPSMYRSNIWVMGMYSGFGSAEEANKRYRFLLEQGQTGFSIALDLPTQVGYDSDYELSEGEVGKVGVAIDSLEDMERLFEGVNFEKVRQIRTTANGIGPLMVALLVAYAEKQGIDPNNIKIFLQNDVLKEYIGRGTYIYPPEPSVKLSADVIEYCSKHLPNWVPIAFSGYHIRDSGSTAIQELAYSLSNAIAYIDETLSRGVEIDDFAPKVFTFLASSVDFLEEVAKFRAARRIWAKLMKEKYGAKNPDSMRYRIFAYTLGGALTAQQPLNNIVRVTIETMAAALGGVQTVATSSFDEALGLPTEQAVTVALRTQQIVAEESGVTNTIDALGGSYAIECLTDKIEEEVMKELERIDQLGGAVACIENGIFQKELAESAYRYQKNIESGKETLVGVNKYKVEEDLDTPVFEVNEEMEKRQIERLKELKASRNEEKVKEALQRIKEAEERRENVIPAMIEAVKVYASVGEISDVLRDIYGIYQDSAKF